MLYKVKRLTDRWPEGSGSRQGKALGEELYKLLLNGFGDELMEFREALDIAKQWFEKYGVEQIACALDAGVCWIFYGGSMDVVEVGSAGVKVMKDSGKAEAFVLPDDKNFELLAQAVRVELASEAL